MDENKTKKQAILCIIGVLVIAIAIILGSLIYKAYRQKKYEETAPILIEKPSANNGDTQNLATTGHTTISPADDDLQNYPLRVMLSNKADLARTNIPDLALNVLELNLDEYFNYYLDTGLNYTAEYVVDSYYDDYNLPYFYLHIKELDMDIQCTWYTGRNLYHFYSDLNPEGK